MACLVPQGALPYAFAARDFRRRTPSAGCVVGVVASGEMSGAKRGCSGGQLVRWAS
jgi:hypothetical protein